MRLWWLPDGTLKRLACDWVCDCDCECGRLAILIASPVLCWVVLSVDGVGGCGGLTLLLLMLLLAVEAADIVLKALIP